jgi:hypothetical protein
MHIKIPRFQLAHRGSNVDRQVSAATAGGCLAVAAIVGERLTLVALAVGAYFVGLQLQETLYGLLVLGCPLGSRIGRPPRHGPNIDPNGDGEIRVYGSRCLLGMGEPG